jgi:uncharacterized protein DUF6230
VKEAQGEPAYGRTNWRRFAVAVGVPAVAAGALVVGLAQGAFAAQLTLTGEAFKIKATHLHGDGFVQFSQGYANTKDPNRPVGAAVAGIHHATLYKLCQSVHPDKSPFSLVITAGNDENNKAEASDMVIAMTDLSGDATFGQIQIGEDASTVSQAGDIRGARGTFAQEAATIDVDNLQQSALYTQASSFKLSGLNMKLSTDWGGHPAECY